MNSKHPNCECGNSKYDYFRRRYRNGTLHLMRKCRECGKTGQNAMRTQDYDANWIETLQIVDKGVRSAPVQSRADQIHAKLKTHIANRTA